MTGTCVAPGISESFLDDSEHFDLLVRREPHLRIDVELDVDLAVRRQHFDVPAQRRVEASRTTRRRERENGKARFLLRGRRSALQTWQDLVERGPLLEHVHLRRDREEVLRQTVVNIPRYTGALVRHRSAELGLADRPPNAYEQDTVGDDAEKVAL